MSVVTWLHFSDLHICPPRSGWNSEEIMVKLLEDLHNLEKNFDLVPDLVCFTGDAVFGQPQGDVRAGSGHLMSEQFERFGLFLDDLRSLYRDEIVNENIFIVPGNHDVDRAAIIEEATRLESVGLREVEALLQAGGFRLQIYMNRLQSYKDFLVRYGLDHLMEDPERLVYGQVRDVHGVRVGIAGLNTAWYSGRPAGADKGRLWMGGKWQLGRIGPKIEEADLSLILLHHPPNWLRADEDPEIWSDLERRGDFILSGHQHKVSIEQKEEATVIAAGASYQDRTSDLSYNIVQFDTASRKGKVWLRRWDKQGVGWIPNQVFERTDKQGVWKIDRRKRSLSDSTSTESVLDPGRVQSEVERIFSSFASVVDQDSNDFYYFSEALREVDRHTRNFLYLASLVNDRTSARRKSTIMDVASFLKEYPAKVEKGLSIRKRVLEDEDHATAQMIQVVLVEYMERFSASLSQVIYRLSSDGLEIKAREEFTQAAKQLISSDGISRYQGLIELLRNHRSQLIAVMRQDVDVSDFDLDLGDLLDAVWGSFDLVLTEEMVTESGLSDLLQSLLRVESSESVKKMINVIAMLHNSSLSWEDVVERFSAHRWPIDESTRDYSIVMRCLTLHPTNEDLRAYCVDGLKMESLWRLLSFSQYPLSSVNAILAKVNSADISDFKKANHYRILFDLQYHNLLRRLFGSVTAAYLAEMQVFVLNVSGSPILLDYRCHERFTRLLGALTNLHGQVLSKSIRELVESLGHVDESIRSLESSQELDESGIMRLGEIPMSKLFAQPLYFYYVITHENADLACRALAHLDEPIMVYQCARNKHINNQLLSALVSRRSSFFNDRQVARAWALNPKAILTGGEWILRSLPKSDLQKVTSALDARPEVKRRANSLLVSKYGMKQHSQRRGG